MCKAAQKKMQTGFESLLRGSTKELEGSNAKKKLEGLMETLITDTIVPGYESEINGIEALDPPAGDERKVEAAIGVLQKVIDEASSDPTGFLRTAAPRYNEAQAEAARYGLYACGTPNKPPKS